MEKLCRDFPNKKNAGWLECGGPGDLTKYLREFNLQKYAKPETYFLPIAWDKCHTAFDKTHAGDTEFYKVTHAVHLANNTLLVDKNAKFDPDSLFEQLKLKHGIKTADNAPLITANDIVQIIKNPIRKLKKRIRRERLLKIVIAMLLGVGIGLLL